MVIFGRTVGEAVIPVLAGAVVEAVSALFFAQDRQTQRIMVQFFEKLREERKLDEGLQLQREISDSGISSRLGAALAIHFVGMSDPEAKLIQHLIGQAANDRPESIQTTQHGPDGHQGKKQPSHAHENGE